MEKKKQTLYNFVSLRSPQSVKTSEKKFRFIEIPKGEPAPIGCMTIKGWEDFVNEESGINPCKKSEKVECYPAGDLDTNSFTGQAQYLAEHRSEIDYYYLMDLHSQGFKNIKGDKARRLFVQLVSELNTEADFEFKEKISDWLILWNLCNNLCELRSRVEHEKALKEAEDSRRNICSFHEVGSKRRFMNEAAKPHIQQLLNATIVLPKPDKNKDKALKEGDTFDIERNGPLETNFTKSLARLSSAFVPSDGLTKKHATNLAAFQLATNTTLTDIDKQSLLETILSNTDSATRTTYLAGSRVDTESSNSTPGVAAAITENSAGTFDLILTPEQILENNKVPNTAVVKIKANTKYRYEDIIANIKPFKNTWYIELKTISSLKSDGGSLFVELTFANGSSYTAFIPMNKIPEGSGELFDGKAFPIKNKEPFAFESRFLREETDKFVQDKEGKDTDKKITEWKLHLSGVALPEAGEAEIQVFLEDDGQLYVPDPLEIAIRSDIKIDLKDFPSNPDLARDFRASVFIRFSNQKTYLSLPYNIPLYFDEIFAESYFVSDSGYDAYGKTYAPKGFGITQLGVADYQRVVSHVVRYEAAEVAHIENLMAREYKEKVVTREKITEVTDFESLETETEKLNDATSAERFQMQTEIAKIQHEDNKTSLDARVSYNGGTTTASMNYANAAATSRDESNKEAITTAKELTNRAMERIVSRVKTERTRKVTDRLTDVSKQGFDNRGSGDHVSGVYRYVNAVYKNEIESYGRRLAYEFAIPEPSRLHKLGMRAAGAELQDVTELEKPLDPRKLKLASPDKLFSWDQLDKNNYLDIAKKYGAEVSDYPIEEKRKIELIESAKINQRPPNFTYRITADDEYKITSVNFTMSHSLNVPGTLVVLGYQLGNSDWITNALPDPKIEIKDYPYIGTHEKPFEEDFGPTIPFTINFSNVTVQSLKFDYKLELIPNSPLIKRWQKEVYKQIITAYEERLKEYNQNVAAVKQEAKDTFEADPLSFRQIEQTILRMNCVSYLIAPYGHFLDRNFGKDFYKSNNPDPSKEFESTRVDLSTESRLNEYAAFVKFLEQAFEWNIMSYNFYPFYWGAEKSWKTLYQADFNDPIFKSFMQAGMARVVVTVRPGFEYAVLLYMITGKIWANGHVPVYGDPNFVSMANELKDPPYTIADHWETVLPTNLIALQRSGAVINAHGLPNFEVRQPDDYDEIDRNEAQFNPIIKDDERVLTSKKRGWLARLLGN